MKPRITRGFGALTPATWAEIYEVVTASGLDSSTGPAGSAGSDRRNFQARITGATRLSGIAVWRYTWEQVRVQTTTTAVTVTTVTNGLTSTAQGDGWNVLELANTATAAYGIAVDSADGVSVTAHPGFEVKPVPTGTIVHMMLLRATDGALRAEFSAANPVDGACEP
jgi:hypothetical protein